MYATTTAISGSSIFAIGLAGFIAADGFATNDRMAAMTMLIDLALDPIWQFFGVAVSLVSIWLSMFIFRRQIRKKLIYRLEANMDLLNLNSDLQKRVEFKLDGRTVGNAIVVAATFSNAGNLPIGRQDYEEPISITFAEGSTIICHEIIQKRPPDLKVSLNQPREESVTLDPFLLNQHENFTVNLLAVNSAATDLVISARIIGGTLEVAEEEPIIVFSTLVVFSTAILLFILIDYAVDYIDRTFGAVGYRTHFWITNSVILALFSTYAVRNKPFTRISSKLYKYFLERSRM